MPVDPPAVSVRAANPPAVSVRAVNPRAVERRLLKLAAWFLARGPATREDVYAEFPKDYRGTPAGMEKMWTRDKGHLQELGIPLHFSEDDGGTYSIEPGSFYLPRLSLSPAEAAVLTTAAQAALRDPEHPLHDDLESALRKLLVGGAGLPPRAPALEGAGLPPAPEGLRKRLALVVDAVEERKRLHLSYWVPARDELTERDVDPYGYALRGGEWLLVGHCHLRGGTRIFYLGRARALKLAPAGRPAPHFEVPEGFDMRKWSRQFPWEYLAHEPRAATVRFTGSLAKIAATLLPGAKLAAEPEGVRVARLEVRNLDGLARQCLAWGPEAELLEPAEGRERARVMLRALRPTTGDAA